MFYDAYSKQPDECRYLISTGLNEFKNYHVRFYEFIYVSQNSDSFYSKG
jgi:hypothetical protein